MVIRAASIDDSEKYLIMLKKLDNETKNMMFEPGERKTTVTEMRENIKTKVLGGSLIIVAEEEDELVGYLCAERGFANRIKHSAYIVLGILELHRGKGLGTMLFKELEKWAKNNCITRLELTVMMHNEEAIRLYEKMGFMKEGIKQRSMIVDGEYVDELYMAKIID